MLALGLGVLFGSAASQEKGKLHRIGQVWHSNPQTAKPFDDAFRSGLQSLGWVEGQSVVIDARYAAGDRARFPGLFRELVDRKVDVLLVSSAAVADALHATSTIPIVCPALGDPVDAGAIASLANPGVNLTGLANQVRDSLPKRLQFAQELVPKLRRLGVLFDSDFTPSSEVEQLTRLARDLGITTVTYAARSVAQIEQALQRVRHDRLQALLVMRSTLFIMHKEKIFQPSTTAVPTITDGSFFADAGALLTYSADSYDLWRRSAGYVDKLLKGAKAADLPVEQPLKFELIVNLKTAQALGIRVPDSLMQRADRTVR